eukprot:1161089-Pelagomonas_calceolata.AAC.5
MELANLMSMPCKAAARGHAASHMQHENTLLLTWYACTKHALSSFSWCGPFSDAESKDVKAHRCFYHSLNKSSSARRETKVQESRCQPKGRMH